MYNGLLITFCRDVKVNSSFHVISDDLMVLISRFSQWRQQKVQFSGGYRTASLTKGSRNLFQLVFRKAISCSPSRSGTCLISRSKDIDRDKENLFWREVRRSSNQRSGWRSTIAW